MSFESGVCFEYSVTLNVVGFFLVAHVNPQGRLTKGHGQAASCAGIEHHLKLEKRASQFGHKSRFRFLGLSFSGDWLG